VGLNPGKLHDIQCFTRIREMYFTPYTELLPSYPTVPQYADIKETIKSLDEERDQLFKDNEPQVREVRSEEKVIT
jgi:hypothetical protein